MKQREVPCKIVYIGPDDDHLLPLGRWVECVPFPKTDMGHDPKLHKKPVLIIGCLSRFCAYARFWRLNIMSMFYDEFGMANWLDLVLASSVVHRLGKVIGVGDDRQTSAVVDSGNP